MRRYRHLNTPIIEKPHYAKAATFFQSRWAASIHGATIFYTVNNSGFDLTYHWGSGFASSKLFVGDGNDKIFGNISSDKVHTGGGNDLIRGGAGNDILVGGAGRDIMRGGKGDDIFYIGDLASTLRTAEVH